jgi:hypothetical protein
METAKQANAIIKDVLALLTEEKDIQRFQSVTEIFNNAAGMVNGNEYCEAILKGWMVSQANNALFLLWRRGILTEELEAMYRELPSAEEAVKDFEEFEKSNAARAQELEAARKKFMDEQHVTDIFKAVLNGMSKEKAEQEYQKMQEQIAQAQGR